jgi:hypothetical protein
MPIEGPLRELGIHDVFQLLDLSRKTGMLRVTSQLRDDEGVVYFDGGRVVHASIRSRPSVVVEAGAHSEREIEVTTESLLMEGARRIDEWSRIADKVPSLAVIPVLAAVSEDHQTQLDLLPHEWEVLTMIDGDKDLRAIAASLGRADFEVAKVAYGLVTTGVIEIRRPQKPGKALVTGATQQHHNEAMSHLELGFTAVRAGNLSTARSSFERFLQLAPNDPSAGKARAALDAVNRLVTAMDATNHG